MIKIALSAVGLIASLTAASAQAWDLEFSFEGVPGRWESIPGKIVGRLKDIDEKGYVKGGLSILFAPDDLKIGNSLEAFDNDKINATFDAAGTLTSVNFEGVFKDFSPSGYTEWMLYLNKDASGVGIPKTVNRIYTYLYQFDRNRAEFGNENGYSGASYRVLPSTKPLSAVPEPATWALMVLGFGVVGYSLRRRRVLHAQAQLA